MKLLMLRLLFTGLVIFLAGCKDTNKSSPQALDERLVIDIMKLDHQAVQSLIRMGWFAGRLDKCLSQLEKMSGLEKMPFDWAKVYNLPKTKYDKPSIKKYMPFYVPCPNIPDIPAHAIAVQLYSDPQFLRAYLELQMHRGGTLLGWDEYIRHTEKRLKRLEDYFAKQRQDVNEYQYSEVTIDNIPKSDIVAIIFSDSNDLKNAKSIMLIGEPDEVRQLLGWNIPFTEIVLDYCYVKKITDDFRNTQRTKREYIGNAWAIFITGDKGYMIKIAADDKVVYGPDYQSEELLEDLKKIGLNLNELNSNLPVHDTNQPQQKHPE